MARFKSISLLAGTALLVSTLGCEQLPGNKQEQGAVIGGASGAAVGAAVGGSGHRVLGALIGGVLGAGGGYLIGANYDKITGKDTAGAQQANSKAQSSPATPEQARAAKTADVNGDGFVTLDEVVAMKQAGFSDKEILDRLRASGQVFELSQQQRDFLLNHGISQNVVTQMENINREQKQKILNNNDNVISRPPSGT